MKRLAKEMLSEARQLASEMERETGLATTAALDDHLLHAIIVLSAQPQFRKPGKEFDYLGDARATAILRTTGLVEVWMQIPPHERVLWMRPTITHLRKSPVANSEEFVTEELAAPLPAGLDDILERISRLALGLGYVVRRGLYLPSVGQKR